jgi:hypothetical protein
MRWPASIMAALLWVLCLVSAGAAEETPAAALWTALRSGGHIAIMRHAEAPGGGDLPPVSGWMTAAPSAISPRRGGSKPCASASSFGSRV